MSSTESTETLVKKHVKAHIDPLETKLQASIEDYRDSTQNMIALSQEQLDAIKKVQDEHHTTLFGRMPPDPKDPGVWRMVINCTNWIKRVTTLGWKLVVGFVTAAGAALAAFFGMGA